MQRTHSRSRTSWKRAAAMLSAVIVAATTLTMVQPAQASAWARPTLVVTTSGERSDQVPLDGAIINSGSYFAVELENVGWVRRIEFSVNGTYVSTERYGPYDMSGTAALGVPKSIPIDDLDVGENVVTAKVRPFFGRSYTVRATFERRASIPSPAAGLGYDFTEVDSQIDQIVADGMLWAVPLNGAGLVVVHPDHGIVHETYRGEITPDRVSLLASTSKTISSGVLLHLADQGLFDMNAPMSDSIDWAGNLADVTPAQLVSNSSGLPGIIEGYLANLCGVSADTTMQWCARSVVNNPLHADTVPDQSYLYGGPQWQVAGAFAESVSGKSWAQLIDEIYVEPCGLDVLGYAQPILQPNLLLDGILEPGGLTGLPYPAGFDGDVANLASTANPMIEGGGYTTPRDYASLLLMHLNGGMCGDTQVISPESLELMYTDRVSAYGGREPGSDAPDNGYGLGWVVDTEENTVRDPGFYGAEAWIDLEDGYAAYFVIEAVNVGDLAPLRLAVDEAMNAAPVPS